MFKIFYFVRYESQAAPNNYILRYNFIINKAKYVNKNQCYFQNVFCAIHRSLL